MKPTLYILILVLFISTSAFAQVKIGDNPENIDPASVLELESKTHVLVITRVNTQEMNAITPQPGAMVYNTEAECVYYYNGLSWIDLCSAAGTTITNDAVVNTIPTIELTQSGTSEYNIEIAENSIHSRNIIDEIITGDDIQNNSIGQNKLGPNSVSVEEIQDNAVGTSELIDGSITAEDFANASANQVLASSASGIVDWRDVSTLTGAVSDGTTITGDGTAANPLSVADNGITTTNILDNNITIEKIAEGANGQILTTNGTNVVWANPAFSSVTTDATISGDGNATPLSIADNSISTAKILDNNVTIEKIAEGANGQVLTTNGTNVIWANPAFSSVTTDATISGDGNTTPLSVADNGISTAKILDNNVTVQKIAEGTDGQILTTNGTNVVWANPAPLNVNSDNAIFSGNGNTVALSILDDAIVPDKIEQGADGQILTTNGTNVVWANPAPLNVNSDNAIFSGNGNTVALSILDDAIVPDKIEQGADGQILTTNGTNVIWANPTVSNVNSDNAIFSGNGNTVALSILDNAIVPDKIEQGTDGQILTTNGTNVIWANPTAGNVNSDNAIFSGNGNTVALSILDDAIVPDKIEQGADGQILTTNGTDVIWANPTAGNVNSDNAIFSGNGNTVALSILDDAIVPDKIEQGTDGQILTTNGTNVIWANPTAGNVNSDNAIFSGNGNTVALSILDDAIVPDKIEQGTDGQILTTNGTDVIWANPAFSSVSTDATISGDGNTTALSIADNAVTTGKILDDNVTIEKIAASTTDGQILTTNGTDVIWANPAFSSVTTDATISGDGNTTALSIADNSISTTKILDDNVTIEKIAASATDGQILTTSGTDVIWADPTSTVTTDASIDGDGNTTALSLADNAVTTVKILDDNVTIEKINASATDGQILTTSGTDVIWADPASTVTTDASIDGDGNTTALSLADNAVTTAKILDDNVTIEKINASATDGQILTTNGTDVVWADPTSTVTTDASIDGDGSTTALSLADNAVTTAKILDDNITIEKINASATDGQILTTSGTDVVWADAQNLADNNLTQPTGVDRTYNINGGNLIFTGTGSVGIGNSANPPQNKLHVAGEIRSQGYNSTFGTESFPAYSFASSSGDDIDTGMWRDNADELVFSAGGFEGLRIDEASDLIQTTISDSFATSIANISSDTTLDRSYHTVIINTGTTNITLPTAASGLGRIYILKNITGGAISISSYSDSNGTLSTTLVIGVTQLQSDGTTWHQIN